MSGESVQLDTSDLQRGARQLTRGLEMTGRPVGTTQANAVARQLRAQVPVRTGRLAATVRVTTGPAGASVHYGASLPYAGYIDKRTNAVAHATQGADTAFARAMTAAAAMEVRKL